MERFYLLDIARGIAAIAVAIFHYKLFYAYNLSSEIFVPENQPFYIYIKLIYEYGWIAVQFFLYRVYILNYILKRSKTI